MDCLSSGEINAESLKTICLRQGKWRESATKSMIQKLKDEDLRLDFIRFSELLLLEKRSGGKTCLARIQTKSNFDEIPA